MNPEKWESVESLDSSTGVMVSNLPLLFAHGMPTSLQKISLTELEVFVPFMVKCSVGEDLSTAWSQLPRPPWWPSRLPFRLPSTRNVLIKLVERCYDYHGCQYLLQFCASLDQMRPVAGYRFTDNRDGTVSMYHGSTGKLLVTFRNENRDYDHEVKPKHHQSLQKKLLPSPIGHHHHPSGNHGSTKSGVMVRPPANDIFLCDKCDDDFSSLKEVQIHERNCKGDRPPTPKIPSPEPELSDDEQDQQDQLPYLAYLGLQPEMHTGIQPYVSPRKKQIQEAKKAFNHSYLRYDTVEVSSPLGRYILSKTKGGKVQLGQLRYERHVIATPDSDYMSTRERSTNRWVVVFRPRQEDQIWYHLYCFTSDQRQERLATIRYGLNFRSRKLLSKFKKVNVKLKRLAKRTIDRATRLGSRSAPCIDLTISEESIPNQLHVTRQPTQFASSSVKQTNQGVKLCQSSCLQMNRDSKDRFSQPLNQINHSLEHSIFGSHDNVNLANPYNVPVEYTDPLGQTDEYATYMNGSYSPGTIISADAQNGSQQILQDNSQEFKQKLWGLGVTVADVCDISNSSDECVDSKFNVKNVTHRGESSRNKCTDLKVQLKKPGPKSKTSNLRITPIYPIHNSPKMNNNNVNSSSLCNAIRPGNGNSSIDPIEIIELSSDDEDESDKSRIGLFTSKMSPKKEDQSHARSFARSKNGYSHWLPVESLALKGRKSGDSAANGGTPCSVSSQPFSSPYFFLYTNPKSDSVDYKPSNHLFPGLFPIIKINRIDFDAISHFNSSLCTDMVHGKRLDDSVMPRIDLDEEVSIKVPLQIDEDTITCCCTTIINENDLSVDKLYNINDFSPLQHENGELKYRKSSLSTLSDDLNKSFPIIKCYVKSHNSSFYHAAEEDYEEMDSSKCIEKFKCSSNGHNNSNNNIKTSNVKEQLFQKVEKKSRCRPEIERLMSDECRELHRRGIGILRRAHTNKSKIITRHSLDSAVPTIKTRNKFYVISSINQRNKSTKLNGSSSVRVCDVATKKDSDQLDSTNDKINDNRASDMYFNIDENGNSSGNHNSRLPLGLTDHDVTDCKLNYTFISSKFYKSSVSSPESCDNKTTTELLENGFEKSNNKKLKNNRCRLSREIQSLVKDECKELKDLGFHPTDILSTSRLSPSNMFGGSTSFNDSSELLISPLSPNRPRRPSLIMSDRKYSPNKKRHENDVDDMSFSGQESVKNMMQSNKRLSRELSKLMKDEWKELKKTGSHPSQIPALLSNQRCLRSYKEPSASSYDRKFGNPFPVSKELIIPESKDSEDWSLSRCTRGQAKMASYIDTESPRAMHRNLIQSEIGMCVVNYDVPKT